MKIYKKIEDIERDFFPALFEDRKRHFAQEHPFEYGKELARVHLEEIKKSTVRC